MDLGLRDHEGARLIESLKKESPEIKAIGLGLIPSQVDVVELMEAGASGFVLKDATLAELLGAIRTVAAGGKVLPPAFTASLFSHAMPPNPGAIPNREFRYPSTPRVTVRLGKDQETAL